jgi:hypothetical protein
MSPPEHGRRQRPQIWGKTPTGERRDVRVGVSEDRRHVALQVDGLLPLFLDPEVISPLRQALLNAQAHTLRGQRFGGER